MAQARSKGWWYPLIFLGFFVVVVSVNLTMAYFATSTFTGLSTQNAYEKGLKYNQNLAMAKEQEALGWTVQASVSPAAGQSALAELSVSYRDRDSKPVDGMSVRALIVRPTTKGYDQEVELTPAGDGRYVAQVKLPLAGEWDMDVLAAGKDGAYQLQRRFILP